MAAPVRSKKMPAYAHSLSRGKRGTGMATAPSTFPNSDDRKEVHWIAKLRHHAMGVVLKLCHLRNAPAHEKRNEYGSRPISNGFPFHDQSNPPATRSRLPMNFVHPYVAPL